MHDRSMSRESDRGLTACGYADCHLHEIISFALTPPFEHRSWSRTSSEGMPAVRTITWAPSPAASSLTSDYRSAELFHCPDSFRDARFQGILLTAVPDD